MFNMKDFDPDGFRPNSAFEGWMFAKIQGIEKNLSNHLSKHNKLEIALIVAGLGLIASLVYIILISVKGGSIC